jgi:hypothetical protein
MSGSPAFKSFTVTPSKLPRAVICSWSFDASYIDINNVESITIYANDANVTDNVTDNQQYDIEPINIDTGLITTSLTIRNLATTYAYLFTVEVTVNTVYKPTYMETFTIYNSNSLRYQLPSSPLIPTFKVDQDQDREFYVKLVDPSNSNTNPVVGSAYDGFSRLTGTFVSYNNGAEILSSYFPNDVSNNLYTSRLRIPVDTSYGVYEVAIRNQNTFGLRTALSQYQTIIVDNTPGEPTNVIAKKYYPITDVPFETPTIEVKIISPEYKGRPAIDYFTVYRTDYNTSLLSSDPSNNNYIYLGDVSANYDVNENLDSSFSYLDSLDLIPGNYYKYKVFSHNQCGQNDGFSLVPTLSNAIVASIYPDQITGLNMWAVGSSSLDASWNHSENFSGIEDNYLVYNLILTDASDSEVPAEDVTTLNVNTTNNFYSFTGLVPGRKYILRVYAGVYDNEEFLQNFFNASQSAPLFLSAPYDVQGLTTQVPRNLRVKPAPNNLTFYWDAAASTPSGLTLSGYTVSLYKQSQIVVPGIGYQYVYVDLVESAYVVSENEYTFYGLDTASMYNFTVSGKYYIGNDTTNIVYSSISNVYGRSLTEEVGVGLVSAVATTNEKKVTLNWNMQYDDLYDSSFNIYRRIKDSSDNILEDFTLIKFIYTSAFNNQLNYVDVSNQTTDFTFGNKIEYYIDATYYDRLNKYSYSTITSNTEYCVLYITPPTAVDVRIKPIQTYENMVARYKLGVTVKWTKPVISQESGLKIDHIRVFIRPSNNPGLPAAGNDNISKDATEITFTDFTGSNPSSYYFVETIIYYTSGKATVIGSSTTSFYAHFDPITPVLTGAGVQGQTRTNLNWTIDSYNNYSTVSEIYREISDADGNVLDENQLLKTVQNVNALTDDAGDVGQSENFIFGNTVKYYVKVTYTDFSNNWTDGVVYTYEPLTSNTKAIVLYNITPLPTDLKVKPLDRHLTLEWTAPDMTNSGMELVSYDIYLNEVKLLTVSDLTKFNYTYNDLSNNVQYTIGLSANHRTLGSAGSLIPSIPQYITGIPHTDPVGPLLTASSLQTERNIELDWTIDNAYSHYSTTSKIYRQISDPDNEVLDANELIQTLENVSTFNDTYDASNQSVNFIYGNKITYYVEVIYTDLSNSYVNNVYVYDTLTSTSKYVIMYDNTTTPQNLTVLPSDGQLTLSWSAPNNSANGLTVTSYNLYLDASYVANVDKLFTSYAYNVVNGQSHTLSVEAVNSAGTVTGITSSSVSITGIAHAAPTVPVLTAEEVQGETKVELSWTLDTSYPYYTTVSKIHREILDANGVTLDSSVVIAELNNENTYDDIDNGENQSSNFVYGNTMTYYVETIYTDLSNSYLNNVYQYATLTSASKSAVIYDNPSTPTGLSVVPSNNHLTLSWVAPDNSANGLTVTGYNVYLDSSSVALLPSTTTTFEYTVTNGQQYTLSVDSVNSAISSVVGVTVTGITSSSVSITGIAHADPAVPVLTADEVQGEAKVELSWTLDTSYPHYTTVTKIYREILDANGFTLDSSVEIAELNNASTYDDIDNGANQSSNFVYGNTMSYYVVTTYTDISNSHIDGVYTYSDVTSDSKSAVIYDNPSTPTGLTVVPSNNRLTLSWVAPDNSTNGLTVTDYKVYLDSSYVATVSSSTTTFAYTVTNGQQYTLSVDSVNSSISSVAGVTVTGITSSSVSITGIAHADPAVPVLTADEVQGETKVELSWTIDASYPHYTTVSKIYREILDANGFTLDSSVEIAELNNASTYDDIDNGENQSANFVYGNTMTYYVVTTYTDISNSHIDGVYTYSDVTSDSNHVVIYDNPSTPTGLTVVPSNNHLTLSWVAPDNSTNGLTLTGYNVYLDSSSVALLSSSATTFEYTVTNGQQYTLSVDSVNSAISSVVGVTVTGITSSSVSITGIAHADPAVPVLTADEVQGETKVELSWTIDASYPHYTTVSKIYREILDANGFTLDGSVEIAELNNASTYDDIDNGANQSTNFVYGNTMTYYVVTTYTDISNSHIDGVYTYSDVTSDSKSAVIYDNPSTPTGLTVVPSNNHLTLSWVAPDNSTNGLTVTGYNVYLDSSSVALLPSTTTTFEYTVTNGQQYTLSVDSVNSAISSVVGVTVTGITSSSVSITGIAHADPAVPVLTADEVQGETKVELSWTIDTSYPHYTTVSNIYREILDADGVTLDSSVLIKTVYDQNAYSDNNTENDTQETKSDNFVYGNTMTYYVEVIYTDTANSYLNGVYTYAAKTSDSKSSVIYDNAFSPSELVTVPSDGILTLSWRAPNNTSTGLTVTGYNLYLDGSFVAFEDYSITSHSYNLTNGQTYTLGVQTVNSAISSVQDQTVTGLLSNVQNTTGKSYKLATSTIIANATNANNGVQAGKTVLLTYTIDNSQSNCNSVEIYRKISSPSGSVLEDFPLIDTVTSNLVNGNNTYIDRDSIQNSVNFLNGNTMTYYVKLYYSDSVNYYSYVVTSNQDFTVPYDRPTPTNYLGQPVTNKECIIPLDLDNGEFTQFNLVVSKNGSDLTTVVAVGLTNGGNGTVLQYSSSSSTVIGNVVVNNPTPAQTQIDGVCAANQVKVITCSFPSPVTDVTDVFAFINNQAGSLLTSYPVAGIFLP